MVDRFRALANSLDNEGFTSGAEITKGLGETLLKAKLIPESLEANAEVLPSPASWPTVQRAAETLVENSLTMEDTTAALDVDMSRVSRAIKDGSLEAIKLNRTVFINPASVERYPVRKTKPGRRPKRKNAATLIRQTEG